MAKKRMTVKQERFADYYIEYGNATRAAVEAGYSKKYANTNANKLLQNTTVSAYIDKRMEELQSERVADQQEVMEFLSSILRGEKTEEVLRGIGKGAQTIDDIEISGADRIKAAELIGKRYKMWTEKQEVDVAGTVNFVDDIGEEDED